MACYLVTFCENDQSSPQVTGQCFINIFEPKTPYAFEDIIVLK